MSKLSDSNTIAGLENFYWDNGRRGEPKPGCDCRQCFGMCLTDKDEARRQMSEIQTLRIAQRNAGFTFSGAERDDSSSA